MVAVEVVMPPAPPPAVHISRLVFAAADAVVRVWIASLLVLLASVGALIGLLACGWGCTGAAWTAVLVSLLLVWILWNLATLLLIKVGEAFHYINQLEKGAAALETISEDVIMPLPHFAIMAFACLEAFGFLLKLEAFATKDPLTDRIATVSMVVSPLGISVLCCLVSVPGLAVRVWRMRRHGRASVVPI